MDKQTDHKFDDLLEHASDEVVESTLPGEDIEESSRSVTDEPPLPINVVLDEMGQLYRDDPTNAVRGQHFIKLLHTFIGSQLEARLTTFAKNRKIKVVAEAKIIGSAKAKDVDITVVDPENGPLVIVGLRSQMSSVAKNVPNYYEMLVGEVTSLQHRFPMASHAYVYLHPLKSIKEGKEDESINHQRYARMYAAITGREGRRYFEHVGLFDHFAYMVVDFDQNPPQVRDDVVQEAVTDLDMTINTLVDRIIDTFKERLVFWDIFD